MNRSRSPLRPLRTLWLCAWALALGLSASSARAAVEYSDAAGYGWFVRAGGRALFGVKASVNRTPVSAAAPGVYDNGFVLPDVRGTANGRTWNWGYQEASQVVGDQVRFQRLTDLPMAGLFRDRSDDPLFGGEIMTGAELARFFIGHRESRIGFEIGYAYNAFTLDEHSTVSGNSTLAVAAHSLGSTFAPPAPYAGSSTGPGPEISLSPSISGSLNSASLATFNGDLETTLHTFKLGVWFEYPIVRRVTANLSVGYASMYADSRLRFTEDITFANPGLPPVQSGPKTVSGRAWKMGGYAQARLRYDFTRWLGVYVAGDFEAHNTLRYGGEGREVTLGLGSLFAGSAGVMVSF
jgi:hypothetical protein